MKKISLVFIFFLSLFCFIEKSNAQVYQRCDYYDANRDYVVQLSVETNVFGNVVTNATVDIYAGLDVNGQTTVEWDDTSSCPQYIAVYRSIAGNRTTYYVYASNNRSDLEQYVSNNNATILETSGTAELPVCNYYDDNRNYVVQIVMNHRLIGGIYADATIDVYNGLNVNGSYTVDWDDTSSCPQYIAVRHRAVTSGRVDYYVYASNNRSDLLGYIADGTGAILGLNGSSEGEPEITNRCYLEYISPAVSGTSRPTQSFTIPEIVHNISFNFYSYDDGTRDFCVSSGSGTISECQNFTNESPTITINIEGNTYSFRINNSSLDAFYSNTCLENDEYSMQEVDGVYVLSASGSGSGGSGSGTPGQVCDGGNCDISLSGICEDHNVSNTLRAVGIIIIIIKVLVPAVIIIVGIKNLFQIIMSGKEDDAKKYVKSIALRVIIGVLIFLLPGIINFFYDTAQNIIASEGSSSFDNCWNCLFDIDECNH